MAVRPQNARVTITVPAATLEEWQHEAEQNQLTVSELVLGLVTSNRRKDAQFQDDVRAQLMQLAGQVERMTLILEAMVSRNEPPPQEDPPVKIATPEDIYGPEFADPPPPRKMPQEPVAPRMARPAKRRWLW
jgi:hypothetical protein